MDGVPSSTSVNVDDGAGADVGGLENLYMPAFISRNLFVDGDMRYSSKWFEGAPTLGLETYIYSLAVYNNKLYGGTYPNGKLYEWGTGRGAFPTLSGVTFTKNSTTPISDELDGELVNTGAAQGTIGQNILVTSGDNLYFFGLHKGAVTPNGASILVSGDGVVAQSMTVTQSGVAAGVTSEVEFCTQAADASFALLLGSGSVTINEIGYWDNVKLVESLVANGSCEGAADPPASWTQEANATVVSDTSPHAGTNCLKVTAGAANVGASQAITLVSGQYYTVVGYAKATAGDSAGIYMDTGTGTIATIGTTTATTWTRIRGSFKAVGTVGVIYFRGIANGDIAWCDDIALIRDDYAVASTATKGSGIVPSNQPMLIR